MKSMKVILHGKVFDIGKVVRDCSKSCKDDKELYVSSRALAKRIIDDYGLPTFEEWKQIFLKVYKPSNMFCTVTMFMQGQLKVDKPWQE